MTESEAQYDEDFVPYDDQDATDTKKSVVSQKKGGNTAVRNSKASRASKTSRATVTVAASKKHATKEIEVVPVPEEAEETTATATAAATNDAGETTANNKNKIETSGQAAKKTTSGPTKQNNPVTTTMTTTTEEDKEDKAWNWKHYHTLYPVANKLLAKKWDDISREKHLKKLANIKKSVDDRPPPKYIHLRTNLKRAQMEQERQILIRRNNKILIEKMSDITKHEHLVENHAEHDARVELFNRGNEHHRKQKNERIHQENLAILERLECSKSDYDHVKVRDESVLRLHHLQNLASFPQKYIKMIKEEVERNLQATMASGGADGKGDTCSETGHAHDRHHWHGCYGGKPVPHALEMAAFPGEEVAAFSKKKNRRPKLAVADIDKAAFDGGQKGPGGHHKKQSAVPPIAEGVGPLARESSPMASVET
ncbi:hypothetical protein BDR26DRAFT_1010485 [Obelidium mucronatum]|nr:hypothetical protein BDR26DRAFT_1010485 [Obelidium mucronatum]